MEWWVQCIVMIPLQHHCWKWMWLLFLVMFNTFWGLFSFILGKITQIITNEVYLTKYPVFGLLSWAALQLHKVFCCLQNYFWNLRRTGDFETTLNGIWHLFSYLYHHQKVKSYFHILNSKKDFEREIQAVVLVRAILFYPCWKIWTVLAIAECPYS